jgi:hypothetical protein
MTKETPKKRVPDGACGGHRQPARILHEQDTITGEEVLPGFQCRVAEFFED